MQCIEDLTPVVADVGDVMLFIDGPSVQNPGQHMRYVMLVAGLFYNLKGFDVVLCEFEDARSAAQVKLSLPWTCRISSRASRIFAKFSCLAMLTSDELVLMLTRTFGEMRLSAATYEVLAKDGSP